MFELSLFVPPKGRSKGLGRSDEIERVSLFVSDESNPERCCHWNHHTLKTGSGGMTKIRQIVPSPFSYFDVGR
jgi:hypothetical protein